MQFIVLVLSRQEIADGARSAHALASLFGEEIDDPATPRAVDQSQRGQLIFSCAGENNATRIFIFPATRTVPGVKRTQQIPACWVQEQAE